jgi:hypothetical protein
MEGRSVVEQAMQRLSAAKILDVWEAGRQQNELDRALTLLTAASGLSRDELADLSIGERDRRLLQLRTLVLGARAEGFAECPECGERVEFPLDTAALVQPDELAAKTHEFESDGAHVRFRLPTSRDVAEAVAALDGQESLQRLVERCVLEVKSPDEKPFSSEMLEALSAAMLEADPQAEISLVLACPSCGHRSETLFDIADFFWCELVAIAWRLLDEIDALARAYGWSEREILDLPTHRRQMYLELVTA